MISQNLYNFEPLPTVLCGRRGQNPKKLKFYLYVQKTYYKSKRNITYCNNYNIVTHEHKIRTQLQFISI